MSLFSPAPGWRNYTMYDVLREDCRADIGNNDAANIFGDLFFAAKDRRAPWPAVMPPAPFHH
jgi:hypothetical protein